MMQYKWAHICTVLAHTQILNWTCSVRHKNPCLCFLHTQSVLFGGSFFQLKCHTVWVVGVAWLGGQGEGSEVSRVRWSRWLYSGTVALNISNEWVGGKAAERQKGQRPDEHNQPSFELSHCSIHTHTHTHYTSFLSFFFYFSTHHKLLFLCTHTCMAWNFFQTVLSEELDVFWCTPVVHYLTC